MGVGLQVYERVAAHAQAGHYMGGSCFWCLTGADYPDYDGFKISFGQGSAQRAAAAQLEQKHATSPTASLPSKNAELENCGSSSCMQQCEQTVLQHTSLAASMNARGIADSGSTRDPQQASCGDDTAPAGYQISSSSHMLRRVSSRTEGNVEAAAAIFDGESALSELQAAHLGAETMYLITEHAAAMHALNQQGTGRDCRFM